MVRDSAAIAALLISVAHPAAAATFFTSATAFDAVTSTTIETYESGPITGPGPIVFPTFTVGETDDSTNFVSVVDTTSSPGFSFGLKSGTDVLSYTDVSGSAILTFFGFAPGTTAFGTFLGSGAPGSVDVTGPDTARLPMATDMPNFVGVVDITPFTSVSFAYDGSPPAVTFDDTRVGTAKVVPLPAPLALLPLALIALAAAGRLGRR